MIAVGAIIGILTVMFTFMLGVTRVWFAMSRDGLLPKWFAKTHPTRHVPTRVTWIVGVASAAIAGFLPINEAAELTNIGILLAFVVVCAAVIVLRYRQPDLPRSFRTPWMPFVPALGIVFSIWLITFLQWQTWVRFAVWFVIGVAVEPRCDDRQFASESNQIGARPRNERSTLFVQPEKSRRGQ